MKIILSGGGTLGSVTPLIALIEEITTRQPQAEFLWLGTRQGPEASVISEYGIAFKPIFSGKLRRYFSWRNFFDPVLIVCGFFQAFFIIVRFKPDAVLTAAGFVGVPVVWASWVLRCPALIHQQDARPSLANKITAPFAHTITVTFEKSLRDFPGAKTSWTGNPVRRFVSAVDVESARKHFNLEGGIPTVLIVGGGTGALNLNELVVLALPKLTAQCNVIHVTGGKGTVPASVERYHRFDLLLNDLPAAYASADVVITRGGMATLTELAALRKPTIIIPMPNTHQVDNAVEFSKNNAAVVLDEKNITPDQFSEAVLEVVADVSLRDNLSRNIGKILPDGAAQKIVSLVL